MDAAADMDNEGDGGFNMFGLWKRLKKAINKFLEDIAKENQKSFGNGKMDCCQLNTKNNKRE